MNRNMDVNSHSILDPVKRLVLSSMPESALTPIKRAYYGRLLRRSDGKQEPELVLLADLVRSGDTVLDIGANIGVYTKRLSELVGPTGRVISMEPLPSTFDILSSNVHALKLANVKCMNVAVSDRMGMVRMEVPRYETGWQNIYRAHVVAEKGGNVQAVALDDVFASLDHVGFIKCDVEGHELAVLQGATGLIQKHHPKWLIEIDGDPDSPDTKACRTFQLMTDAGYRPYIAQGSGLVPRQHGMTAINYFFL